MAAAKRRRLMRNERLVGLTIGCVPTLVGMLIKSKTVTSRFQLSIRYFGLAKQRELISSSKKLKIYERKN